MIYLLTAIGLSSGGSSTVHIYTQTIHRTTQITTTQITTNVEECGPCPVFASFTLAFALQMKKKHGETSVTLRKTSVRVQYTYYPPPKYTHTLITTQYKTTTVQIKTKCIQEKQHNGEQEQYPGSNVVNPQV
jgi:hypothetical protein